MGRPPKPPELKRTKQIHLNLTPFELGAITEAAKANGKDCAAYVRELILEFVRDIECIPTSQAEQDQIDRLENKIPLGKPKLQTCR